MVKHGSSLNMTSELLMHFIRLYGTVQFLFRQNAANFVVVAVCKPGFVSNVFPIEATCQFESQGT